MGVGLLQDQKSQGATSLTKTMSPSPSLSSLTKLVDELATALQKKRDAEEEMAELAKQLLAESPAASASDATASLIPRETNPETTAASAAATRSLNLKMALQQLSYAQQEAQDTIAKISDAILLIRRSITMSISEWENSVEAVGTDYRDRIAIEQERYALAKQERRKLVGRLKSQYAALKDAEQSI